MMSELYDKRREDWLKTTIRYTKLVANSGFMFSLYLAIIFGGVYYQKAISKLPPHFPAVFVLLVWFGIIVIPTSIRTHIQKADLVFLLPAEDELGPYFRKAIRDSWVRQAVAVLFLSAIAMPLYLKTLDASAAHFGLMVLFLILLKGWNVYGVWSEFRQNSVPTYKWVRGLLSLALIYVILVKAPLVFIGAVLLILIAFTLVGFRPLLINEALDWTALAEEEARHSMRFLRLANWVTDVPGLLQPVKPRIYLDGVFKLWEKRQQQVYPLLFLKTFLRAGDYYGLFFRLTLIATVMMVLVREAQILSFVIFGIALFLTAFQLLTLAKHDFPQALEGLYPIENGEKRKGYLQVIRLISLIQSVLLSLVYFVSHWMVVTSLIMLVAGSVFSMLWIQWASRRQLEE